MCKDAARDSTSFASRRWSALTMLCLAVLMTVLDSTVVNVALPSIAEDLAFTQTSLVWVVNGYMLSFGSTLLLGGRLGDLYGARRLFLVGLVVFTMASAACGVAPARAVLIASRAVQGAAGALVVAVALSLTAKMFAPGPDRAKAMSVYSCVSAGGGIAGLLLGGTVTSAFDWRWVFLINVPVGVALYIGCRRLLQADEESNLERRVDLLGALTITAALMIAIYAIVSGNEAGWRSTRTVSLFGCVGLLLCVFLTIQLRVAQPLLPLSIFSLRSFTVSSIVRALWAASAYPWFFMSALYLQLVLSYDPMQVGLVFLPANLITAAFALGLSAKLVARVDIRILLGVGLACVTLGLALLARLPVAANVLTDVLPAMILVGLGSGIAFSPLLLASMSEVRVQDTGVASGIVNTASIVGGALGLAAVAAIADARTHALLAAGVSRVDALAAGYRLAFVFAAVYAGAAALTAVSGLRRPPRAAAGPPRGVRTPGTR